MPTFKIELRHARSKNHLNVLRANRLAPLLARLESDGEAVDWAREELLRFSARRDGIDYQYWEAAIWRLLPIGPESQGRDSRRLGRWVRGGQGLVWRPAQAEAEAAAAPEPRRSAGAR